MAQVQMEAKAPKMDKNQSHPKVRMLKEMLGRFLENKLAIVGGVFTVVILFTALFAPVIAPYDPTLQNYDRVLEPPSWSHWFGTDNVGRDLLSRVIYGTQISIQAGFVSVGIALLIGIPIGLLSGYYRGFWDEYVIMRITDALLAFPTLVLALALAAILGAGLGNVMFAIGLVFTPNIIRLIRAEVLSQRELEYVEAAKASGIHDFRVLFFHIFPNSLGPILVQSTLMIAAAIIAEASLSYLGLGTPPPTPSWGAMLSTGQGFLQQAPWIALFPGIFIFLTVISINLFGDGIRDAMDSKK